MTQVKCDSCEALRGYLINHEAKWQKRLTELLDRSGMDISPCRVCSQWVICIPDGLALCKDCAKKAGE
jgi:hypothetical protein